MIVSQENQKPYRYEVEVKIKAEYDVVTTGSEH